MRAAPVDMARLSQLPGFMMSFPELEKKFGRCSIVLGRQVWLRPPRVFSPGTGKTFQKTRLPCLVERKQREVERSMCKIALKKCCSTGVAEIQALSKTKKAHSLIDMSMCVCVRFV